MTLFRSLVLSVLIVLPAVLPGWNLTRLATFDSPNYELMDVEIQDNYAYVPAGLGGLNIIDISNPSSPAFVSEYHGYGCEFGRLYAWHVGMKYAYGSGRYCGIKVIDVFDPENPVHVSDYGANNRSYEHTDGTRSHLFAAVHTHGVEIIDISAPMTPKFVALVPTENAWAVEVSGDENYVYVADGAGGLKVIDVKNPKSPQLVGDAKSSGTAKDVVAVGKFVFVAVGASGVDMFDVSDRANPILAANYNTSGYASRVAVSDILVAVSDWDDIEILNWDESPSLTLAGYKNTGGRVMAVNMVNDIIYSAEWRFFRTFRFDTVEGPDIDLSFRNVDFPHTPQGVCRDTAITITNNGMSPLLFEDIELKHGDYEHNIQEQSIEPGESIDGTIEYCAQADNGRAELLIRTNDPDEPEVEVRVDGNSWWGVEAGERAPDFTLESVNDLGSISLSDLRGRIVVVAFFATW